ncbi:MAG: polyphosphate polymerase domain-containing protein [Oscillospiraceae bacterium]|jgi:hypothetical protein|nr:polyphosphate polymerase domain-containing protein [Oscillospiraceae bacterium]
MECIFQRYETKYLVTRKQGAALRDVFLRYMEPDRYGAYLVQNLYYDTEGWDVIRASVDKPFYKEKLRLRCYGPHGTDLFLELKKKFDGIVYKRRIALPESASVRDAVAANPAQIARELEFYLKANDVSEKIYLAYNRTAITGEQGLRVTFDTDIRFRTDRLDFKPPYEGIPILPGDRMLIEIKTLGGAPIWMARALSEHHVYPTPFSKVGTCYINYILGRPAPSEKRLVELSA